MLSNPWDKFFWNDWETDPALKLCSLASQGLWMRILCICAKADPKGYLVVAGRPLSPSDLSSLVGKPEPEVETLLRELASYGVFSTDRNGRIYSRRMVRDVKKARTSVENGKKGGNPTLSKQRENQNWDNPPLKPSDKPHKPEAISQKLEETSLHSVSPAPQAGAESKNPKTDLFKAPEQVRQEILSPPPKQTPSQKTPDGFEDFWQTYPKRVGRIDAEKAYRSALSRASPGEILAGAGRYATATIGQDRKYIAHPSTWLHQGRWMDEEQPTGDDNDKNGSYRNGRKRSAHDNFILGAAFAGGMVPGGYEGPPQPGDDAGATLEFGQPRYRAA